MTQEQYDALMAQVKAWPEWLLRAVTLWAEARGESEKGKRAVAYVMKQRQEDKQLWNDILGPKQFSCWNYYQKTKSVDPNFMKMLSIDIYGDKAFQECIQITFQVMFGWAPNPFQGADHYYAKNYPYPHGDKPDWAVNMGRVGEEGAHVFLNSKVA